jgi:membrane associated rhomboid family serine protease
MFFPVGTDRRLRSIPYANVGLIAANVIAFLLIDRNMQSDWTLDPGNPTLVEFVSYQFAHLSWQHLLGNMAFLYVFGNSVEDRMGSLGYLFFYLAGGVLAGVGHAWIETSPVLGASGAVCAVTGAYLALFPLSRVTVAFLFVFGSVEVPTLWLVVLQAALDGVMQLSGQAGVAYLAHLTGYAFGFAVGLGLLVSRLIAGESTDVLAIFEHRKRRYEFRAIARQGYQPWEMTPVKNLPATGAQAEMTEVERDLAAARAAIIADVDAGRLEKAARAYVALRGRHAGSVLPRQPQLDVASQLMAMGQYEQAACGYDLFLRHYPDDPQKASAELILAVIRLRYLGDVAGAQGLLRSCVGVLSDADQIAMAKQLLEEIGAAERRP